MGRPDARACELFLTPFRTPTQGPRLPEHHQHREEWEGGGGRLANTRRRRHRGKAAESEKGDATADLLLKHRDTTLATYV